MGPRVLSFAIRAHELKDPAVFALRAAGVVPPTRPAQTRVWTWFARQAIDTFGHGFELPEYEIARQCRVHRATVQRVKASQAFRAVFFRCFKSTHYCLIREWGSHWERTPCWYNPQGVLREVIVSYREKARRFLLALSLATRGHRAVEALRSEDLPFCLAEAPPWWRRLPWRPTLTAFHTAPPPRKRPPRATPPPPDHPSLAQLPLPSLAPAY